MRSQQAHTAAVRVGRLLEPHLGQFTGDPTKLCPQLGRWIDDFESSTVTCKLRGQGAYSVIGEGQRLSPVAELFSKFYTSGELVAKRVHDVTLGDYFNHQRRSHGFDFGDDAFPLGLEVEVVGSVDGRIEWGGALYPSHPKGAQSLGRVGHEIPNVALRYEAERTDRTCRCTSSWAVVIEFDLVARDHSVGQRV